MRWVILSDDWPPQLGGVATWGFNRARQLAREGHEVIVFARQRPHLMAPEGVHLIGVPGPSFGRYGGVWTAVRALPELARADRILATTWTVAAGIAGRISTPLEVVFHGSDVTRDPADARAFHRVCEAAERRWAVSDFLVQTLANRGVKAEWTPSPLPDLESGGGDPTGPWTFVGRATELKGGDRFVRLCAAAGRSGLVIGDGPALQSWTSLSRDLGAQIAFAGALPRRETWAQMWRSSRVFLLPRTHADGSGAEGLGLVLLEARAMDVQVVGCRCGGVPEALGPSGVLLNDPDDVARSLEQLA